MLVMNIDRDLRGSLYFGILAHELRHLIEFQYDQHEADWEIEGTATLAQLLASDTQGPSQLQNSYLANPDVQLNGWTTDGSGSYYGVGYLFSRYILERMGLDFFSTWVRSPQPGFFGIEDALIKTNTDLSPLKIWQDFGIAIALLDEVAPAPYSFSDNFDGGPVDRQVVGAFPANLLVDVKQYAFQFYEIRQQGTYTANFVGTTKVAALQGVLPASGHKMWWGGRANYSDVFLSREFDLSEVDKATFNYSIYHHIQSGFDSAHLLISTDGGQSWTELIAPAMMSAEGEAIFGHIPLTEHFYSGQSLGWLSESVDLSEYAGQVIQLRFQYFTDALITDPGIALDNLSIPEIGFYDDAELSNAGWQQQGFTRVSAYLPQRFQVSLITFDRTGLPIVEHIELDDLNAANFEFTISAASRAFLVIGGSTPTTLSPARFSLTLAKTP